VNDDMKTILQRCRCNTADATVVIC